MAEPRNEQAVPALLGKVIDALNKQNKILEQMVPKGEDDGPSPAALKQAAEDEKVSANKTNTLLSGVSTGIDNLWKAGEKSAASAPAGAKGGMLAGIGGALGKMGIGAGVAMGGLGALFAGGGYLLKQISEFDGKAVVANVKELAKIADIAGGIGGAFSKGGSFLLMMTGIGLGLAAFSIGAGVAAAVKYFTKGTKWAEGIVKNVTTLIGIKDIPGYDNFSTREFLGVMTGIGAGIYGFSIGAGVAAAVKYFTKGTKWAEDIVKNVTTLISIQSVKGYDNFKTGEFLIVMTGIGAGIAAFGIGSAVAAVTSSIAQFSGGENWAQKIVDNVTTLISIQSVKGYDNFKTAEFLVVMTGIGAGIAAFGIGSAVGALGASVAKFSGTEKWAQKIVDNVTTLISIQSVKGYDNFKTVEFIAVMGGIAAGLVAFAIGKAASSTADAIGKFTGNFADNIVKDVKKLIGLINDPDITLAKAQLFSDVLGKIGWGLTKFSAGKFVGALAGAAAGALNFLSGNKSPIEKMKEVANSAAELERGAAALGLVSTNLNKVGSLKFSGGSIKLEEFTKDLLKSIPVIEKAIMGGTIEGGWLPFSKDDVKIKGLASGDIKFTEAAANISKIRASLGMKTTVSTPADTLKGGSTTQDKLLNSIEALTAAISAGGGGNTIISQTSKITTTGNSGQFPLQNNKNANLNRRLS